jgi:tRNA(fMet)-specific endonuclease VapC
MRYVLDTNILLLYLRGTELSIWIDQHYRPLDSTINESIISVVTVGEIRALAKINHWGQRRLDRIDDLLEELLITDINTEDLIERYAEIDAFSHDKIIGRPLGMTARNMGKNDLWIAATTSILDATLLTTDKDFNHLHNQYLNLEFLTV